MYSTRQECGCKGVISSSLVMAALAPQPRQPRPSIVVENSAGEVKHGNNYNILLQYQHCYDEGGLPRLRRDHPQEGLPDPHQEAECALPVQ